MALALFVIETERSRKILSFVGIEIHESVESVMNEMKGKLTPIAKGLRKRMTDAELRLWKVLRGKQVEGLKFRRQQPIGPFIVDFVCFERKLVVEADGSQHYEGKQKQMDARRDAWLREQGFEVLRFSNSDIITSTESVITQVVERASLLTCR